MENILLANISNADSSVNENGKKMLKGELTQFSNVIYQLNREFKRGIIIYLFVDIKNHKLDIIQEEDIRTNIKEILRELNIDNKIFIEFIIKKNDKYNVLIKNYNLFFNKVLNKWGWVNLFVPTFSGNTFNNSVLFMEAIKHWGKNVHPVWIDKDEIYIQELNYIFPRVTIKQLFSKWLNSHDYHAILDTLDFEDLTLSFEEKENIELFKYAIKSIISRLNYDFEKSLFYWLKSKKLFDENIYIWEKTKVILTSLVQNTNTKNKDLNKIVELYRHLTIYLETDDIPAFLVRFYRFREAVLLYVSYYGQTSKNIYSFDRKSNIYLLISSLANLYDNWEIDGYYGAYFYSKSKNVSDTLYLRNISFVGHGRKGFSIKNIWTEYSGYVTSIKQSHNQFEHDTRLLLRDLGTDCFNDLEEINSILLSELDLI